MAKVNLSKEYSCVRSIAFAARELAIHSRKSKGVGGQDGKRNLRHAEFQEKIK